MTAASSIRQANAGQYDFYLALHSNASGPSAARAGAGASSPSTIPPAPTASRAAELFVQQPARDLPPAGAGVDTGHRELWERSASPGFRRYCWSSATTTTPRTPCGSRRTSPAIAARPGAESSRSTLACPSSAPTAPARGSVSTVAGGPVNLRSRPRRPAPR